ncbi:response regulator [Fundidesulfovibrio butyratiphilus]
MPMETMTTHPIVVLAERNRHVRDFLRREFERAGYAVKTCALGCEAGEMAMSGGDVLVLDLDAADIDLGGVIRRVCARKPGLPVVVRAHSAEEAEGCLLEGRTVFVPKDQDPARLLRAVCRILENARKSEGCGK